MIRVLLLVIGYCLGMIQTGYLYGRMKGIDIRKAGSGNSGATNSLRVLGKKAGLIVFAVDLCKCFYSMFDRKGMGCFKRTAAYGRYLYAVSGVWCYFGTQLSMLFKF